ncbi:MAG: TIR domain-containing protein [Limnothrix sp.]
MLTKDHPNPAKTRHPSGNMDAFISYCRRDKAFVQRLHQAFKNVDREVWIDWEGIPLSSDWRREIFLGIEAANNFVYTISAEAAASPYCDEEVEHAIKHNKRLIPIVWQSIDPELIHPEMSKLNWIFFREEDNFEQAFNNLLTALDTDLAHVEYHTTLLNKALTWETKKRETSFLLQGKALQEAETWLAAIGDKDPKPTGLHTQYTIASGQAASRRQKIVTAGVGAGLFVTLILAGVAVLQWSEAVRQRRYAQEQRNNAELSKITAWSALAQARLLTDDDLGALSAGLLAAEGVQEGANSTVLQGTVKDILQETLYSMREKNRLEGHEDQINYVTYSPNGQYLASAGNDDTARIWKANGELLHTLRHNDDIRRVAWSPDNQLLATGSRDEHVRLWTVDGELRFAIDVGQRVRAVRFHPTAKLLVTGLDNGVMLFWDWEGNLLKTIAAHDNMINDVNFSPDGQVLATSSHDRSVKLWDLDGNLKRTLKGHTDKVWDLAFNPAGDRLASASSDNSIKIWQVADGQERRSLEAHTNWVRSVSYSPDGKTIASSSDDDSVKIWSRDGTLLKTFRGSNSSVRSVSFSTDGNLIASASDDHSIRIRSLEGSIIEILQGHRSDIKGVRFSQDGELIATVGTDNTLRLWQRDGATLLKSIEYSSGMRNVNFAPDGEYVITASYDKSLQRWKLSDLLTADEPKPIGIFEGHQSTVKNLSIAPDNQWVVSAGGDGKVIIWSIDGQLIKELDAHTPEATDVVFLAGSQHFASAGGDGVVKVWTIAGELIQEFVAHDNWINSVNFNETLMLMATGSGDRTVRLWQWEPERKQFDPQPHRTLEGHLDWVWDVAFSPDGRFIATAGKDDTAMLWNSNGDRLSTLRGHSNWVRAVTFSPDGSKLASASADKTVVLWDVAEEERKHQEAKDSGIPRLIEQGCLWMADYLATNQNLDDSEKKLCKSG